MENKHESFLNVEQAASLLGVNLDTVRRLIRNEELPGEKLGKSWRIPVEAVMKHAAPQGSSPPHSVKSDYFVEVENEQPTGELPNAEMLAQELLAAGLRLEDLALYPKIAQAAASTNADPYATAAAFRESNREIFPFNTEDLAAKAELLLSELIKRAAST